MAINETIGKRNAWLAGLLLRLVDRDAATARYDSFPNRAGAERTSAMATIQRSDGAGAGLRSATTSIVTSLARPFLRTNSLVRPVPAESAGRAAADAP